MKITKPLVIFDLETTGTWVTKDKIVEIGMIRLMPDGSRENYLKRVNPGIPIPANVSRIINITDEDVKNEPPFKDIAKEVLEFMGDADLGGFNIQRFDIPILEREVFDAGLSFHYQTRNIYDTQKIYHLHEKRDLVAAYQLYCNKELHSAHTALGDAEATVEILDAQIKRYGQEEGGVESLKDMDYEQKSDYFDKERKFCWWNGELYPVFGKYGRKKHIKSIYRDDRRYLEWILTKDFSDNVKELIRNALNGKFPDPPKSQFL
ncbi:MAG: 3'-5' exonuclease [Candidatus Omnitrophica bacterium]|nr:3'-5' exonuclease [Candidatus Omnitrophota bacterium]